MKRNMIMLLGFLGFLGLLGFATGNYGFFGFFGFFSFFAASAKTDERLAENAYKAGYNGFVAAIIGLSILITALSMDGGLALISLLLGGVFIAVILVFVISIVFLEKV